MITRGKRGEEELGRLGLTHTHYRIVIRMSTPVRQEGAEAEIKEIKSPKWEAAGRGGDYKDMQACSKWESSLGPVEAGSGVWGEMTCNNGTLLLWWSGFPPWAFPIAEVLTPVPSCCPVRANSSPLWSALHTPYSSIQPLCKSADTLLRLGHACLCHGSSL